MDEIMNSEEKEMIANARDAYKARKIDRWQLWGVYFIVARAMAERAVLQAALPQNGQDVSLYLARKNKIPGTQRATVPCIGEGKNE